MVDYLIVGMGLGGLSIARHLEKAEKSFQVFDDDAQGASRVAGGLMNPVILKRFTLAWGADHQMATSVKFYQDLEQLLKKQILRPLELYRKFASVEEQNNWFAAADNPRLAPFLDTQLTAQVNPHVPGKHGFGRIRHTKRIDPKGLLEAYSHHLRKKEKLRNEFFDYSKLEILDQKVRYKGTEARRIIFCDGFGLLKNPHFNYLPLRGNKGEYIIVRAPGLDLEVGVKSSVFIFPIGGDKYAVGATYDHLDKSPRTTTGAKKELVKKLRDLIDVDVEVVDQVAGVRPSSIDRRPMIGRHPVYENLYCCNGFGSRGILLAPTMSGELLEYIEKGKALSAEVNLDRFTRKWFS